MKVIILVLLAFTFISCKKSETENSIQATGESAKENVKYKVEFVELGSVNCIPCKKMQPIMKSIEEKYKGQVKVTFHDVWKDDATAKKYDIELIPTQVFLDPNGNEITRHLGFYPEEEIDKFLQSQGVNISSQ